MLAPYTFCLKTLSFLSVLNPFVSYMPPFSLVILLAILTFAIDPSKSFYNYQWWDFSSALAYSIFQMYDSQGSPRYTRTIEDAPVIFIIKNKFVWLIVKLRGPNMLAAETSELAKSKQKFSPRTGMLVIQGKPSCYFNVLYLCTKEPNVLCQTLEWESFPLTQMFCFILFLSSVA